MHVDFLKAFMQNKVPVTKAMGISVVKSDDTGVEFRASIDANINDKGVAFGGSLFSVASLASWAVVDYLLKQKNVEAKIFVHTAQTKFCSPVTQDFSVVCSQPSEVDVAKFLEMVAQKGKGRLTVKAEIHENGILAFESTATYVAVC
ncbi:MAG: YiiD C-terminal domain-containing protein [Candidatus Paracaedibacteraceae bacterium]|nr:YiiD C-terminal domain-containing protein [Candidatus Paracaedibacteraceae bacterium]